MKQARTWITLIGSTPEVSQALGEALREAGYTYTWFREVDTFLGVSLEEHPRCIVVDFDCEQRQQSMAMLEKLANAHWRWPVVVVNSRGCLPAAIKMIRTQNFLFLDEHYSHEALLDAVHDSARFRPYRMANGVRPVLKLIRSLSRLTPREMVIAGEMLAGHSSKQIARCYDISEKTVELHRSRVLQKMNAHSTTELLWMYLETGAR